MPTTTKDTSTYSRAETASVPNSPSGRSRRGRRVSSPRFATASKPVYAKNTTAAAVSTPATPNAEGSRPNSTCDSGRVSPDSSSPTGCAGGTKGVRFAAFTKNAPATTTNTQMATLTTTSTLVTRDDCRIPSVATPPSTSVMRMAPTLTVLLSPNIEPGRCSNSARYPDHPRATTAAPSANSSTRSQPMIQAM